MIRVLHDLFHFDKLYIGGGNVRNITIKPNAHLKLISNQNGILGGFMVWNQQGKVKAS
jgi:polyphosphate glucokinase